MPTEDLLVRLREYRPQLLSLIERAADSPAHAFLIKGRPGSGLREVALLLAAMRICPDGGCLRCPSCKAVESSTHVDLRVATGGELKAEALRGLLVFAELSPELAANKAIIIDGLERLGGLTPMLLKTVEEPPRATTWVFTAVSIPPDMLPIASRCYQIEVGSPGHEEVKAYLAQHGLKESPELLELVNGRLDRVELISSVPDWPNYFARFQKLPELINQDPSWLSQLAFELEPKGDPARAKEVLAAGLEVCLRHNPRWLSRIVGALDMLERNVSVRLVLTWLVFDQ